MTRTALLLVLASLSACSTRHPGAATSPEGGPPVHAGAEPATMGETPKPPARPDPSAPNAPAPPASTVGAETTPRAPAPPATAGAAAAHEEVVPAAASGTTTPAAPTSPAATAAAEPPLPRVAVANIGMHIGGGPNDDVTKDPVRRSVQPHFDAFRRCFAQVEDARKAGDFGVDLRIDAAGGKARVSHPRTTLKGKDFKECVVGVFGAIDFLKPRRGTTTVSYSLRFTPVTDGGPPGKPGSAPKPPAHDGS